MTSEQILSLAPALAEFLGEFADCFGRCEPRQHLNYYVRGQLSNLQRKSVEPIALFNNIAPRTLQEFLASDAWNHARARDRVQQIVARDHEDPMAGVVDDADGLGILMIACDDLLNAVAGARVIPGIAGQELLQRAWGDVVEQRDGLDALALQITELPAHVIVEMLARLASSEAVGELAQELRQGWCERKNLLASHP